MGRGRGEGVGGNVGEEGCGWGGGGERVWEGMLVRRGEGGEGEGRGCGRECW